MMNRRTAQNRVRIGLVGLAIAILSGLAIPQMVKAQEAPAADATPPDEGSFTYSRNVHHSIGAPFFPGPTQSIVTGPTNTIVGAIGTGLEPLSDDEAAFVSASLAPPAPMIEQSLTTGLDSLVGPSASGISPGERSGSVVGKTIDGAMDTLSSALGTMTDALGAAQ